MNTNIINKKRTFVFLVAMFFSASAFSQAFSSGGGSLTGYKSTLGNQNTAGGNYSLAAGCGNQASGQSSFALGYGNNSVGLNSIAIGMFTKSQNSYGITIGTGYSNTKPLNNNTSGIMLGSGSNLPTLFISYQNIENRTGKVGIGNVTSPQAKLHVAGDANEDASILLEASSTKNATLQFRSSNNKIMVGSDNVMKFNASNMQFNPTGQVVVNGAFKATGNIILSGLAGTSTKVLAVGSNGQLSSVEYSALGDNLGDHIATKNINLNGKKIVNGTSGTGGIFVSTGGKVRIGTGTTAPTNALEVNGTTVSSNLTVSTNLKISSLASTTKKVLVAGTSGQVSSTDIYVSSTGDVGINTDNPQQKLHVVDGNILISKYSIRPPGSTNGSILFGDNVTATNPFGRWGIEYLDQDGVKGLNFWKTSDDIGGAMNYVLFLCSEENEHKGNVGIGTGTPAEKLTVNGRILAQEVIVTSDINNWPDYVFAPEYNLMSLSDLEAYVNEHHHLPNVPSAKEVEEQGISLGEMNAILLQKVEEMTLRMIEMEKRIHELESQSIE
jgi:hypothetical protein